MADRRLTYRVGVEADSSQLVSQINSAVEALKKLSTSSVSQLTPQLQEASRAALELSVNLQKSMNTETGKFDLLTFNNNLKRSGMTITEFASKLRGAGQAGEEAFYKVAQAITTAELPIRRANKLLDSLWTTMKNTMRWQLTSTALRTFIGGIQTAYGYAKDLNESLTRIQIVTKDSTEEMAKFAKQANEAAKTLSTTTTKYTGASLIYYQQGLNDEEVKARTDATIKYSNVAGITAEAASEQLTAIWNNFAEGTEQLEYYIDVIAKLGATTASSSSEISEGMQKFAAVASTVGLSYEYAAAALATITATTRESADIVGTSLRTLFARLQSLKLGETLDDGTTLAKYSEALEKVGVHIKDANGQLKDMDIIIDDLGSKWGDLSRDTQMALAQTVAGVRQYTQFITLMDNFDFFKENLATARGSEGELQKQADIYANSWEAARDRVKAAAEDIYDSLFSAKTFTDLDDALTPVLTGIANTIDSLGGLGGVIEMILALVSSLYGEKIAEGMRNFATNIGITNGYYQEQLRLLQEETAKAALNTTTSNQNDQYIRGTNVLLKEGNELRILANQESDKLNNAQKQLLDYQMAQVKQLEDQLELYIKQSKAAKSAAEAAKENIKTISIGSAKGGSDRLFNYIQELKATYGGTDFIKTDILHDAFKEIKFGQSASYGNIESLADALDKLIQKQSYLQAFSQAIKEIGDSGEYTEEKIRSIAQALEGQNEALVHDEALIKSLVEAANKFEPGSIKQYESILQTLRYELRGINSDVEIASGSLKALGANSQDIQSLISFLQKFHLSEREIANIVEQVTKKYREQTDVIKSGLLRQKDWADTLTALGSTVFAVSSASRAMTSFMDVFSNKNLTNTQIFTQILSTTSLLLPVLTRQIISAVSAISAGITSLSSAMPVIGLALTALTLIVTAIGSVRDKVAQAAQEAREESYEAAKAANEEAESNTQLILTMQKNLSTYQETGEGKETLDETTRTLAEAYDLEGGALARLSGKYSDYNNVLSDAINKKRQQLNNQLDTQEQALKDKGAEIQSKVDKTMLREYEFNIEVTLNNEARDLLTQTFDENGIEHNTIWAQGDREALQAVLPSDASPEDFIKLYDILKKARGELSDGNIALDGINEYLTTFSKLVDEYRKFEKIITKIKLQLGQGLGISDQDVKTLQDYRQWEEEVRSLVSEDQDADSIIADLIKGSFNPDISKLKDINDAIKEIKSELSSDSSIGDNFLEKIFSSDDYDTSIISGLNWSSINTVEEFNEAYTTTSQFKDALDQASQASQNLMNIRSALSDVKNGKLDEKALTSIQQNIDWGNEEAGIIEFTEFLQKTAWEQTQYLNQLLSGGYQTIIDKNKKVITKATKEIQLNEEIINSVSQDQIQQADSIIVEYNKVKKAWEDYQDAVKDGKADLFDVSSYKIDWGKVKQNWNDFKDKTADEIQDAIDDGTKDAKVVIEKVEIAEAAIESAMNQKESAEVTIEATVHANFDNQIDQIKGSVDGIVSVFDAISKGISVTTDEAGQQVWAMSVECAEAISSIYPGFISNAKLLEDGTFALTDSMYQAFFNSSNGQLGADADAKAGMLDNGIAMLEAKREQATQALGIAQKLASGQLKIDGLSEEQKEILLSAYKDACALNNGKILANEVNTLTTSDTNWSKLWTKVGDYSFQGAKNMATNVADGTKSVLENLEKIRAAAYKAGQQISAIGSGEEGAPPTDVGKIDTSTARWTGGTNNSINDSSGDAFLTSLQQAVGSDAAGAYLPDDVKYGLTDRLPTAEEWSAAFSQAVGQALVDINTDYINSLTKAIDAFYIAKGKLLKGINNAYTGAQSALDKLNKKSGGGSGGSSKNATEKDISKRKDKYHEINRELEYQDYLIKKIDADIKKSKTPGEALTLYQQKLDTINKKLELMKQRSQDALDYLEEDFQTILLQGYQIEIDTDTMEITNWEEIYQELKGNVDSKTEEYNKWIRETYNGSKGELNEQKTQKDNELKAVEKRLENFETLTGVYESDLDVYRTSIKETISLEDELYNLNKEATKEQLKALATIAERYHKITREISLQKEAIEDLENAINRSFGTKKLQHFSDKLAEINKQIKNYEKKFTQANEYAQVDYNSLVAAGINVKIDPDTNEITNYDEIIGASKRELDNYYVYYSNLMNQVNSAMTQGERDTWERRKQEAETHLANLEYEYNRRQTLIKQYEDTIDKIQEARDAWEDMWRELEDTKLKSIIEKLNIVIQVHDVEEAARKFSKKVAESLGDELTHGAKAAKIGAENAKEEAKLYSSYLEQYNDLKQMALEAKVFEDGSEVTDIAALKEQMEELQSKIISSGESLLEWVKEVKNLVPDAIDAASKRFAAFTDQLEHNSSILDLVKELYTLQGVSIRTEEGYRRLRNTTREKYETALSTSQLQKEWMEGAKRELDEAEEALAEATEGTVQYDILKGNRDALLEQFKTAQKAYLTAAKEAYQEAQNLYDLAMQKTKHDAEKLVTGGLGFDLQQDKYDHYIEEQSRYLDNVNELYEVNKWNLKLQESIDKATTNQQKERLKALQEEIDLRRRGQTLSKYDLEILNAKYEMTLKQMALEDVQNTKNQLKLVRDSNGNWNYQYVADEDQIASAKQEFLEAENNYYNIAKQQVQDISAEIIATTREMYEKLGELRREDFDSEEEYEAAREEIKNYYLGKIAYLERQQNKAIIDMNQAALTSLLTFTTQGESSLIDMKGNAIPVIQDFSDETIKLFDDIERETGIKLSDTDKQMIAILRSMGVSSEEIFNAIKNGGIQALYDMGQTMQGNLALTGNELADIEGDWKNDFAETLGPNGMTGFVKDLKENVDNYIDQMDDDWNGYQEKIKEVGEKTGTTLDDLDDIIGDVSESTDECRDAGLNAAEALWEQVSAAQEASQAYAELAEEIWGVVEALEELANSAAITIGDWSNGIGVGQEVVSMTPKIDSKYYNDLDWSNLITNAILGGASESTISQLESIRAQSPHWKDKPADQIWKLNDEVRSNANKLKEQGVTHVDYAYDTFKNNDKTWQEWLREMGISFDTGGYTGEFEGDRLGILHQKELILNKEDTSNILSAVAAVRSIGPDLFAQIERVLDGNAVGAISALANKLSINVPDSSGVVEQDVKIEAVFPNVTQSNEIQDALTSLVNDAAQFARRRTN